MSEYLPEGRAELAGCPVAPGCLPCGTSGLGALSLNPASWWEAFMAASLPVKIGSVVAGFFVGRWLVKKTKVLKANRRRGRGRRRNAPFVVKGVFPTIGEARTAYGHMGSGYRSLVDLNRRKGRSGKYKTRKVVAQHRLSPGAF